MSINNINKYKKALVYTNELRELKEILIESLQKLEKYKKYIPAQECIEVLSNSQTLVQTHLNHQRKIVETKGKE